jgi:hypothetical protein
MRTAYQAVDGLKAEDFQAVFPWALSVPGDAEPDTEPARFACSVNMGPSRRNSTRLWGWPSRRPNFTEPRPNFGVAYRTLRSGGERPAPGDPQNVTQGHAGGAGMGAVIPAPRSLHSGTWRGQPGTVRVRRRS